MDRLTPLDIQNQQFKKGFRGYDENQVEDFLNDVLKDYEFLYKENLDLKDKISSLENKIGEYKNLEEVVRKTMVMAQESAERLRESCQRESETILDESRQKARQIVEEAEWKMQVLSNNYIDLKRQLAVYNNKIKGILNTQLELLDSQDFDFSGAEKIHNIPVQNIVQLHPDEKIESTELNLEKEVLAKDDMAE